MSSDIMERILALQEYDHHTGLRSLSELIGDLPQCANTNPVPPGITVPFPFVCTREKGHTGPHIGVALDGSAQWWRNLEDSPFSKCPELVISKEVTR